MSRGGGRPPVLFTYGDVSLTRDDVALLDGRGWFNDQLLSFFCEWLTRKATDLNPAAPIVLLPPPLVFFLTFAPDASDVAAVAGPLRLAAARAVLLFVNSSSDVVGTAGPHGEHWSVLLWDARAGAFSAWDSNCRSNAAAARRVAAKLRPHLGRWPADGGGGEGGGTGDGDVGGGVVVENVGRLPQQQNTSDCGPFACAYAYAIVQQLLHKPDGALDVEAVRGEVASGPETRQSLRAIIDSVRVGGDGGVP